MGEKQAGVPEMSGEGQGWMILKPQQNIPRPGLPLTLTRPESLKPAEGLVPPCRPPGFPLSQHLPDAVLAVATWWHWHVPALSIASAPWVLWEVPGLPVLAIAPIANWGLLPILLSLIPSKLVTLIPTTIVANSTIVLISTMGRISEPIPMMGMR